jgi:hypothetical protein
MECRVRHSRASSGWLKVSAMVMMTALSTTSLARDRLVRVFFPAYSTTVLTGGSVPANKIHTLLFIEERCSLPIMGAESMFRAWRVAGAYQLGCWYPTLNDEFVYVNAIGQTFHAPGDFWEAYPHGLLHDDGSVTIIEPHFDSRTFFTSVQQKILQDHLRELHNDDKP